MGADDFRALTPLIYGHINLYWTFRLNVSERITIEQAGAADAEHQGRGTLLWIILPLMTASPG